MDLPALSIGIRNVRERDLPFLKVIFAEDDMPLPSAAELLEGFIAVNDSDEPVGFIRILSIEDAEKPDGNGNYVYPVIVGGSWQRRGVAKALVEHAYNRCGELKLVACKASRGFYPKCGFEPLGWDEVAAQIAHDCELCPELTSCNPEAFILR